MSLIHLAIRMPCFRRRPVRGLRLAGLSGLLAWAASAQLLAATPDAWQEPRPPGLSCGVIVAHQPGPDQPAATAQIQQALAHCPAGSVLQLQAGVAGAALLSGPLRLPPGVSLWLRRGVTLYASRDPRDYDRGDGRCGHNSAKGGGCQALISIDHGADQGLYGEGVIDGQGGRPMLGSEESWWQLARRAQREHREENAPRLIQIRHSRHIVLDRLQLRNAPNFHVSVSQTDGFTAWGIHIQTPGDARNTDGIDPAASSHVLLAYNWISTGDDDVAIKAGPDGPSHDIRIVHNHFYQGHGLSIGSEIQSGVWAVQVQDLSLDGTRNGLRIKSDRSRGGLVRDVSYTDICMRDVSYPLVLDSWYNPRAQGQALPQFQDIRMTRVHALGGGQLLLRGLDADHPLVLSWQDVVIDAGTVATASDLRLRRLGGPATPLPQGPDVSVQGPAGSGPGRDCEQAFPAFR